MEKHLSNFISGGFLITCEVDRPSYVSPDLLPDHIVSASGCIGPFIPDTWCIEWTQDTWDNRIEESEKFGLSLHDLNEITEWATSRFGRSIGWPNVIFNYETAEELVIRFLRNVPGVRVLELCLHRDMVQEFCKKAEPLLQQPGFAPNGRQGIHEAILEEKLPIQSGDVLGFEPLAFDYTLSCSWLCNSLDTQVEESLGIKPNRYGFIDSLEEAVKCVEYISGDDICAEPGLWLPWLVIDHMRGIQSAPRDNI